MPITTRSERKRRRLDALAKLNIGWGVGDTISYLVRDYKITRRSANLDVAWASTELCKNFDNTENADMLAWLLTQIQRVDVPSKLKRMTDEELARRRDQVLTAYRKNKSTKVQPSVIDEEDDPFWPPRPINHS